MNDYREPKGKWTSDLEWANNQDARVERLWSRVFGGGVEYEKVPDGTAKQRSGCDRIMHQLEGNRRMDEEGTTLEEKIRRVPFTKYNDVLFELEHQFDDGRIEQGWAGKWPNAEMFAWIWLGDESCKCDWILAIPTGTIKIHFEAVIRPQLRLVPDRYFRTTRKNNVGYKTKNLHLPVAKALPCNGIFVPSRINWP